MRQLNKNYDMLVKACSITQLFNVAISAADVGVRGLVQHHLSYAATFYLLPPNCILLIWCHSISKK